MIRAFTFLSIACSTGFASCAQAQELESMFQSVINEKGKSCASVTVMKPLGTTDQGTPIVAVACSGGETYAVQINPDKSLSYISTCSTLQGVAGVSCF